MAWYDFFKIFNYAFTKDPLSQKQYTRELPSAGHSAIDNFPNLRGGDGTTSGTNSVIRVQNDLIDQTTTNNRSNRYKEYDRLVASTPEIDMAMSVFADEACVAGSTLIQTVFNGEVRIDELVKNKAHERFPVYCYNFESGDYTIGWAFNPRFVKVAKTINVILDNGQCETVTEDHRILLRDGTWTIAAKLKEGDELMPFHRIKANQNLTKQKANQFPRIFTFKDGWVHERQFLDEWRLGKNIPEYDTPNYYSRLITSGLTTREIAKVATRAWDTIEDCVKRYGFSFKELKLLNKTNPDRRRIIGISEGTTQEVYDLSVEKHENFCTKSLVMHNCQKDDKGHTFEIICKNQEVKDELEFIFFHRNMLNFNHRVTWDKFKRLLVKGDAFWELIINLDNPKEGIYGIQDLPPETMFRIESTKGKLIEFQQAPEGPDYQAIEKAPIDTATESELAQSFAIRFSPKQVVHTRLGDYRKTFYPYGVSLIEPARGPAHQLRMMEDALIIYRLCISSYDKITLSNGNWKYMKDITINDLIYTYNQKTKKLEKGKIAWHGLVGQKTTYKVKSKHTNITGTSIHPVLVFDELSNNVAMVRIKDLIPGQHHFIRPKVETFEPKKIHRFYKQVQALLSKEQINLYKKTIYDNKKELIEQSLKEVGYDVTKKNIQKCWSFLLSKDNSSVPQDLGLKLCDNFSLGEPIFKNKGEKNPHRINLPTYVDNDFAMLFGFLLGDGCINWNGRTSTLIFAAGEYPELNKKYQSLMIKYFGTCSFQQDKRIGENLGMYRTNSKTVCEIMENLGYIGKAHTKRIPNWLFNERPEIRKAFIQGFADADGLKRGMIHKIWNTTIRLCQKELIEDIKHIWEGLGLHCSEIKEREEPEKWFRDTCVSPRKSWEIYISETEVPFYDKIISITECDKEDVYDLTVDHETEHNFLCNGVPVSNTRAPERRIFYIDVGTLPSNKVEAFMERIKDQFRKKKVVGNRGANGASAVEEKYHAPAQDEDFWVPTRANSNTKIDVLPGAQNLGEIDDCVFFRNKLFTALNFPKNYFSSEDPNTTRMTLSSQDVRFSKLVERLQSYFEEALWQVADSHLVLRGFPAESYNDLIIKMTSPGDARELSKAELIGNRISNANSLKSAQLMSDFDILTKWMKYTEDETNEMISRLKIQKLEDLKMQVLAQNPALLGVGIPGAPSGAEVGSEPGGPNSPLNPDGQPPMAQPGQPPMPPEGQLPTPGQPPMPPPPQPDMMPPADQAKPLPNPSEDDISRYDLELQDYESEMDVETPDYSELE